MRVRRIAASAMALGIAVLPAAADASTGWVIQSTVNPSGTGRFAVNKLEAVSCTSPTSCAAVGTTYDWGTNADATMAQYWDGTSWQQQPTPNPADAASTSTYGTELRGVKCVAVSACMAVGQYTNTSGVLVTLAESWNGSEWAVVATPNPAGSPTSQLNSVACTAATNCIAVGYYKTSAGTNLPLAEHWNGSNWALQPVPAIIGGHLRGVSCTSASACTAVGYHGPYGLALRWNGSTWKSQSVPKPKGAKSIQLNSLACTSATVCIAVGSGMYPNYVEKTLSERWNGKGWQIQSTPNPNTASALTAVSCTSASACTATGATDIVLGSQTLAEFWNGSKWGIQPTPDVASYDIHELRGVSCVTTTTCTAVGDYFDGDTGEAPTLTLAMSRT